ncbi:iron-sulfur cluster assembly accessory protein [Sporolactobacillus sp. CPB3-1]|uniref:Iron-sulfur cluster assembly accessory protein n=1 Tax=Sporolactobacillus mangiferae TaxID=2940498 RepID=A0ABT0M8A8_9BACL|nr:iron-sulfur cluster assembly accessory protein [Sporolactobacillus mangiferae]MCL1631104.1 iron-sulfur cluster assembly accessory protein [Sporolactobacillus mangiferae]
MNITLTDAASFRVREMLDSEPGENLFLRVGVSGGGCSGLTYGMGFDDKMIDGDLAFEGKGFKVIVDQNSAPLLDGVTIDFKQNLDGGGFTIDNPNAISTCGCGHSFKTADNEGQPAKQCDC